MSSPFSVHAKDQTVIVTIGKGSSVAFYQLREGRKQLVFSPSDFALAVWDTISHWPHGALVHAGWVHAQMQAVQFPEQSEPIETLVKLEINPITVSHRGGETLIELNLSAFIYTAARQLARKPVLYIRELDCGVPEGDRGHQGSLFERTWETICTRRLSVKEA